MKRYYLDTCIWLNLFKKEGDASKGTPYWKIAKDFIEKIIFSKDKEIMYSGFILKELRFKLNENSFNKTKKFLKKEIKILFVKAVKEDYILARKLESESQFLISFYDCLHIAICQRLNLIMITRDNELIRFAKNHIKVSKPEELFS